jgi:hypothetical protein
MLGSILTAVANLLPLGLDFAKGWQERKLEMRKVKHEAEMQRIMSSATERDSSWKDEFVLIVVAYPLVSVFIPGLRQHTIESLEYLAKLPDWVVWSWLTVVGAIYGMTKLLENVKR